jgi:hypothetical protein
MKHLIALVLWIAFCGAASGQLISGPQPTISPTPITNSASASVVPISDGTNLIASSIVDDGTLVTGGYGPTRFSFDGTFTTIGDIDSVGNNTSIQINDGNGRIFVNGSSFRWNGVPFDFSAAYYVAGGNAGTPSAINLTNGIGLPSSSVVGTATNDNADNGYIGQYFSASVVQGSAVSLSTATPKTVTSILLTAGDWDVTAIGSITGASTGTEFDVAISTTTNSLTGTVLGNSRCQTPTVSLAGADATLMIPSFRVSIPSAATYYLIVQETFTIGSPAAYGRISARRAR